MVRDACKRVTGGNQRLVERDDSAGDGDKSCVSAMVAVKWSRELDEIDAAAAGPDDWDRATMAEFWAAARAASAQVQAKLQRREFWWLGCLFDTLLPQCLLVRMARSSTAQDNIALPLCIGNVGVVCC